MQTNLFSNILDPIVILYSHQLRLRAHGGVLDHAMLQD